MPTASAKSGQVTVGVDYREFRDTYGGDWATRLRFTTQQDGNDRTVMPSRNNGNGDVIADVPVGAQPQTLMVAAGDSSGAGDYKKSGDQSSGSATWSIGGSSGDFEWSLPIDAPPSAGGPSPSIGLSYSSGALDGLSSATNNQTSIVGQGFSLDGRRLDRAAVPDSCAKDLTGNNGTRKTGDLCFAGDSLNISVNGKSGRPGPGQEGRQRRGLADARRRRLDRSSGSAARPTATTVWPPPTRASTGG